MDRLPEDLELHVFAVCDVGNVRSRNEDVIVLDGDLVRDDSRSRKLLLSDTEGAFIMGVADGVGGSAAGDEASVHVAQRLYEVVTGLPKGLKDTHFRKQLQGEAETIHESLLKWGRREPENAGMATTFAGIAIYDARVWWVNAGDSRVYGITRAGLRQLSRDHSLREMTGNPAIPSNIIANCFGADSEFFVDIVRVDEGLGSGDGFLVCSDGLSDLVDDDELEELLAASESLQDAGRGMVARAKEYGGRDNISVVLASLR
jgi:protein phosphatase